MSKCKAEVIQIDLGTFRHNQDYPGIIQAYTQPTITCSKLTIEILEQGVKYVQS